MLVKYLTTTVNFLAANTTPTISDGMGSIWIGLEQAIMKIKEAIYAVLPAINDLFRWYVNYFKIPFNIFVIIKIINFFHFMVKGFLIKLNLD